MSTLRDAVVEAEVVLLVRDDVIVAPWFMKNGSDVFDDAERFIREIVRATLELATDEGRLSLCGSPAVGNPLGLGGKH